MNGDSGTKEKKLKRDGFLHHIHVDVLAGQMFFYTCRRSDRPPQPCRCCHLPHSSAYDGIIICLYLLRTFLGTPEVGSSS